MSTCTNTDLLRDYAFDEIPAGGRAAFERHLEGCADCAAELDQLRLTTAALRILPDREPPQRIAFVSGKVFAPSRLWNFAPWLGFASAAVMAVALVVFAYHRPVEVHTVVMRDAPARPVAEIVNSAVAQAQAEDARAFKAELAAVEAKHEREHLSLVDAIQVLQSHQYVAMSSANETNGSGQ